MRRRDVLRAGAGFLGAAGVGRAVADAGWTGAGATGYEPLGFAPVDGTKEAVVDGEYAYLAATSGFAVVDVSDPAEPTVVAERRDILADREGGPLGGVWDVAVEGDRLLVVGPAGGSAPLSGMAVYDVADPTDPALAGFHATDFPIHNADVADGVAYLTAYDGDRNPLVTVDATTLEELGRWSLLDYDERWDEVNPGLRPLHDVTVRDGRAALAYWDAGTWLLDISDPAEPAYQGAALGHTRSELVAAGGNERLQLPGNDHYSAVNGAGTLLGVGREAWDATPDDDRDGGPGGVDLYDITDLSRGPQPVATIAPPPTPDATYGGTWTTAHNFDFAGDRLYTSWYRGGVKIHDVSDPAAPRELAWWRQPGDTSFWAARHAGDAVVASSRDGRTGLFTFPDRAGEQADPPPLTTATATATPTATPTTADAGTTTTVATPTTTTTATTTTERSTTERSTTATERPPTTTRTTATTRTASPGTPGVGVGATLLALGVAAWRRLR